MKPVTKEQIKLLQNVADSISKVSDECFDDVNFLDVINEICPKFDLITMSMDDLASQWNSAIREVEEVEMKRRIEGSKLLPFLNDIKAYNDKVLDQQENIPKDAKTYSFEYRGCDVYDVFRNCSDTLDVVPYEYYPIESLKKVVGEWLLSGWSV
jgi:hypothetical protein